MKAIDTYYNGHLFRSRLEARWAVFFDVLGIRWEYEPEGFSLEDGTCYLPDFYLPDDEVYVEVKPDRPGAWKDISRASVFVGNGIDCLLLLSAVPIAEPGCLVEFPYVFHTSVHTKLIAYAGFFGGCFMKQFPSFNGAHDLSFSTNHDQNDMFMSAVLKPRQIECMTYEYLNDALDKARTARFEYGQTPEVALA